MKLYELSFQRMVSHFNTTTNWFPKWTKFYKSIIKQMLRISMWISKHFSLYNKSLSRFILMNLWRSAHRKGSALRIQEKIHQILHEAPLQPQEQRNNQFYSQSHLIWTMVKLGRSMLEKVIIFTDLHITLLLIISYQKAR